MQQDDNIIYNDIFNSLIEDFNETGNFKNAFEIIGSFLKEKYGFEGCTPVFLTTDKNNFYIRKEDNDNGEFDFFSMLNDEKTEFTYPLNEKGGKIALCLIEKKIQKINSLHGDLSKTDEKIFDDLKIKSAFSAPIIAGGKVLGALLVYSKNYNKRFPDVAIETIENLSENLGIIFNNLRLSDELDRTKHEIESYNEISHQISTSMDFRSVFYGVFNYLKTTYDFNGAMLNLLGKNKNNYIIEVVEFPQNFSEFEKNFQGKIMPVIENKYDLVSDCILHDKIYYESEIIPSTYKNEQAKENAEFLNLKSILMLPIKAGDEVIGVLSLLSHFKNVYLEDFDIETIKRFVNQIAITLRNTKLYAEIEKERSFSNNILENSPFGIQVVNSLGEIVYINPAGKEISGFSEKDLKDYNYFEMKSTIDAGFAEALNTALEGKAVYKDDVKFVSHVTGKTQTLNIGFNPVWEIDGMIDNVLVMYYDNTEKAKYIHELAEKNKIITEDLFMAKQIQTNILSKDYKKIDSLEFDIYFKPMMEVGGDIYDIFSINKNYIRVFLADATGHGVQAALTTMIIKSEYDKIKLYEMSPEIIIKIFNNYFIESYHDLTVFFTCIIVDIDLNNGKIIYSAAGHPTQYLVSNNTMNKIKTNGMMIGIETNIEYQVKTLNFSKGDKLLLFTDGLFEVFNEQHVELDEAGLHKIIQKHCDKPIAQLNNSIINDVEEWQGSNKVNDDITLISIEKK